MHPGAVVAVSLLGACALAQKPSPPSTASSTAGTVALGAPELGAVAWGRDLVAAQRASEADGRPLFVLFQEVPG